MNEVRLKEVITRLMNDRKISVRKLSSQLKIPQSTLQSIINSKDARTDARNLLAIANYFSVSLEYLIFGKEKDATPQKDILGLLKTENVFSGWLKVRIDRALPDENE